MLVRGGTLLGELDQLVNAGGFDDVADVSIVVTFVGDLEKDIRVTALGDPVHRVDHRALHRLVVLESLIVPEIKDAEQWRNYATAGRANSPRDCRPED
jgi:hypothetical protein